MKTFRLFFVVAGLAVIACNSGEESTVAAKSKKSPAQRGEYLVTAIGCNDCHTPFKMGEMGPEPDMNLALSGHPAGMPITEQPALSGSWMWAGSATNTAFAGPWGISFSANLTPDRETGLGIWTEKQFIDTIRTGKHWGIDRPILPPMPWQPLSTLTDDDLKAIYAYLQQVKPIRNAVPRAIVNAPPPQPANSAPAAG